MSIKLKFIYCDDGYRFWATAQKFKKIHKTQDRPRPHETTVALDTRPLKTNLTINTSDLFNLGSRWRLLLLVKTTVTV